MNIYRSRVRMWAVFVAWVAGAVLCAYMDSARRSTSFLLIYSVSSAVVAVVATRKARPRNYNFELVRPGVVRSSLGFEVRASSSRLEYVEGDHVISWQASPVNAAVGRFNLSENGISAWESPYDRETIDSAKKRDVVQALKSALIYLQLVDAGKIQPKQGR